MQILKTLNLLVAFILELGLFTSLAWWGFHLGKTSPMQWVLAIVMVAVGVTLWGIFAAPHSGHRLPFNARLLFEMTMFLVGAFLLYRLHYPTLGLWFAIIAIASVIIAYIYKQ